MSHHNTLFSRTPSLIPGHVFQKLEYRHKTGRSSRKFGFKERFTVMAFIQLAARRSMRDGHIPAFTTVTDAKTHEIRIAKTLKLPKGSIVVFDKGFISYPWFRTLGEKVIFFVTRLKRNAVYKLLERRPVNRKTGVTSDHIIEVFSQKKALRPRRIGCREPESGKHYEFLTNHFRLSPKTIADIYKERWKI